MSMAMKKGAAAPFLFFLLVIGLAFVRQAARADEPSSERFPKASTATLNADLEAQDARRVDKALGRIQAHDTSTASRILTEVIANAPQDYVYEYERDGVLHVKFWDQQGFQQYVSWLTTNGHQKRIKPYASAYPRAYFHLAFLKVASGEYQPALDLLEKGERLEPTNVHFTLEKACVYSQMKRYREALGLYDKVQAPGPYVSERQAAMALRQKGIIHVEFAQEKMAKQYQTLEFDPQNEVAVKELTVGEQCLKRSLKFDPESKIAISELAYVQRLRVRGVAAAEDMGGLIGDSYLSSCLRRRRSWFRSCWPPNEI